MTVTAVNRRENTAFPTETFGFPSAIKQASDGTFRHNYHHLLLKSIDLIRQNRRFNVFIECLYFGFPLF